MVDFVLKNRNITLAKSLGLCYNQVGEVEICRALRCNADGIMDIAEHREESV